jgi:hypothetical protein
MGLAEIRSPNFENSLPSQLRISWPSLEDEEMRGKPLTRAAFVYSPRPCQFKIASSKFRSAIAPW